MFTAIAAAISAGRKLYAWCQARGVTPASVRTMYHAGQALYDDIRAGHVQAADDDGTPLTPEEFAAKFDAWEAAQESASQHAADRIDRRHAGDGTGEP